MWSASPASTDVMTVSAQTSSIPPGEPSTHPSKGESIVEEGKISSRTLGKRQTALNFPISPIFSPRLKTYELTEKIRFVCYLRLRIGIILKAPEMVWNPNL